MNIALCGIGTVGSGVVNVLNENLAQFQDQYQQDFKITHVLTRNPEQVDRAGLESAHFTQRVEDIYEAEDIDVVVEVMGGVDFAYQVIRHSLAQGRHVVTANKDLLALHIDELMALANEKGVSLLYEASVAGGIPIINGMQVGLAANHISSVMGILNGTTNYMLTHMTQDGWSYQEALAVAQEKGYAEADPTNDVGGFDAARKITLLSRLAYQTRVDFNQVSVRGIDQVEAVDIARAYEAGLVMKLIGKSSRSPEGIQVGVEPVLLAQNHPLAGVSEAYNAVYVEGNAIGSTMFWGPGAGSLETASAVVADLLKLAQGALLPDYIPSQQLPLVAPSSETSYYLRFDAPSSHVRAVLQTLEIGYQTLVEEDGMTIRTEAIDRESLAKLATNTSIVARYQII